MLRLKKYMKKIKNTITQLIKHSIYILFLLIIIWLCVMSGFSTSYINISTEYTYYVTDNIWKQLLAFLLIIFCIYAVKKIGKLWEIEEIVDKYFIYVKYLLLSCIGVVGLIIVLSTQTIPRADQMEIVKAAYGLSQGDYSMFMKGGYVQVWQNQKGIVLFIYFLSMIFGNNNYIVFQLLNVLSLVLLYKELLEIAQYLGVNKICQLVILIFGISYLPLNLYITFVYGTIISLTFAVKAIKHELRYFENFKICELFMASFSIAFSIMIKSNSLIVMIAMLIYGLFKLSGSYKIKTMMLIISIVLLYLFQSVAVSSYIELKTGLRMEKGVSSWAHIAMGLQEGYLANGWWNQYNRNTFYSNDCDSDRQAEEAKSNIRERIKYFMEDKEYAAKFFGRKMASQWNNPTFQCFWIVNKQSSNIQQPEWIKGVYSVQGQDKLEKIYNVVHFIILMGCLLFLIFDVSKMELSSILMQMIVIGGFVFHIFWEAKCQYTLSYFMLLVPMSIKGYADIGYILDSMDENIKNKHYLNKISVFGGGLIGLIVFVNISDFSFVDKMLKIENNNDEYIQYLRFNTTDKIKDGNYDICSFANENLAITCLDLGNETSSRIELKQMQQDSIYISTKNDRVYFKFNNSKLYLDLNGNKEIDKGRVQAYKKNDSNAQKWVIKKDEEYQQTYYILIGNESALTYDNESEELCIKVFDRSDEQKWIIRESS